MTARQRPAEQRRDGFVGRRERKYGAEVFGEPNGERSDGPALADGEDHPAVKECGKLAIGFAQENVLAASLGIHRRHFGKGEASQQRDKPADDPHAEEEQRLVNGGGDLSGSEKDARADDAADHQHDGVHERESADERGFVMCGLFGGSLNGLRHDQPIPRSSAISSGVPQTRQITAEQSPQVSGSSTSRAQLGQYSGEGSLVEPFEGSSGV